MEGVAQKSKLEFDYRKFAACFRDERFDMYFPTKGLHLPIPSGDFLVNTLEAWEAEWPGVSAGYWRDYILAVVQHCGEWHNRVDVPDEHRIPMSVMMIAGLLQADRKIVQAGFKRLYGRFIDEKTTAITHNELRTVAFALWNPIFVEYKRGETWIEFVDGLNRHHTIREQQKARRQAAIADLLTELV